MNSSLTSPFSELPTYVANRDDPATSYTNDNTTNLALRDADSDQENIDVDKSRVVKVRGISKRKIRKKRRNRRQSPLEQSSHDKYTVRENRIIKDTLKMVNDRERVRYRDREDPIMSTKDMIIILLLGLILLIMIIQCFMIVSKPH